MNAQDRQLLDTLTRRQQNLEIAVAGLKIDLQEFAARLTTPAYVPPPRHAEPPIPSAYEIPEQFPIAPEPPPLPPLPTPPTPAPQMTEPLPVVPEGPGLEIQFGRWLARIGVVFALLTLIFFSVLAYKDFHQYVGPWSKLTILTLVSLALIATGVRLERTLTVYGRTLAGGGLACLYYTLYGATYVRQLEVIHNPYLGTILLLAWSAGVLWFAERRKSELLSIFAISLAYFSSVITPVGSFTMVADLLLAATAVVFLVRNAWTGLSYLCLIGTYLGVARQIYALDQTMGFPYDIVALSPSFWPLAIYLTDAWIIFTAGVFLARAPDFAAEKRLAFLSLNNGAWAGLLLVAAKLSGYGHHGDILCLTGAALLGAYFLGLVARADASDVSGAYLAQGLALATSGVVVAYHGVTRGLIITVESVFLAAAGAYSRNPILRIGAGLASVLGTTFLVNELVTSSYQPWLLTFGGALAMLANAWFARFHLRRESREVASDTFVVSSGAYICLALGLLFVGIGDHAPDRWIAPDYALCALALSAAIYFVPLFELPPLSQGLLLVAQVTSFGLPLLVTLQDTHSGGFFAIQPQGSQNIVALVTMLFVLWWPRQKRVITTTWLAPLMALYAMAMVTFTYNSVHPHVSEQTWMMSAAGLSLVFLAFGAWNRSWAFIGSGQILLALSVFTFFATHDSTFWAWWAALVPIAVVFLTGWIAHQVLARVLYGGNVMRENLRMAAVAYQTAAIVLLVRWIFGIVPTDEITLAVFALATAFLGGGLLGGSSYFVRAALVLDLVGCGNYIFAGPDIGVHPFAWLDASALMLFLAQPALLRYWGRELISDNESWLVVLISSGMVWLFVSNSITSAGSHNLTLGWALLALALIVLGFVANERRQRWCGLGLLVAAMIRVGVHDFWSFTDVGKLLTFFALTVICLGLSFLYYKFADRLKEWL